MKKIYICFVAALIILIAVLMQIDMESPKKIGATYMNMNNPYFIELNDSIKQVVEANGDILITRDPVIDQQRQNDIVLDMIKEDIDVLIIQPVDEKIVQPAIDACYENGIPIIIVDSQAQDNDKVAIEVVSNNYKAGQLLAQDINKKNEEGKIFLIYQSSTRSSSDRAQGFLDNIDDRFEIVEVISNVEGLEPTMEVTEDCILNGVVFDIVVCGNDPTALGAFASIQKFNMQEQVDIYGVDGSPDVKTMIAKGYIEGTSAQHPCLIGRVAVENMYKYLRNEGYEKEIVVDVELITEANLSNYSLVGWQ